MTAATRITKLREEHRLEEQVEIITSWRVNLVFTLSGLLSPLSLMVDKRRELEIYESLRAMISKIKKVNQKMKEAKKRTKKMTIDYVILITLILSLIGWVHKHVYRDQTSHKSNKVGTKNMCMTRGSVWS